MSTRTLLTAVRRLSQELIPPGAIVTVQRHGCEDEAALEARALDALGRRWRPGDMFIVVNVEGPCPQGPHAHDDRLSISPRIE
jgi:hypothetical protein